MMDSQYIPLDLKTEHEMFVSGRNGSNVYEISIVASIAPLSLLQFKIMALFLVFNKSRFPKMFLLQFGILVGFVLMSLTLLSDYSTSFLITILLFCLLEISLLMAEYRSHRVEAVGDDKTVDDKSKNLQSLTSDRPCFITNYRAYVNLATSICILAVDFPVFPRRFCKTETFGTGLMDVGVGSFVVSNGIISREARGIAQSRSIGFKSLPKTVASTWPLLVLGLSRIVTLKSVDYHEHVSEYGVHWNFFFTLAFVKISSSIIFTIFSPKHSLILALLITGTYEYLLTYRDLSSYLLAEGNRSSLLHGNREGLWSCLGYLGLYLASVRLGSFLLTCQSTKHPRYSNTYASLVIMIVKLSLITVTLWAILHQYQNSVTPVSRRMANLPYVIWMMAYNSQMITSFLLADVIAFFFYDIVEKDGSSLSPSLLESINDNGLTFFLASNLLTGLVNVSMETIHASDTAAFYVLALYLFVLCTLVGVLHHYSIRLKFW